MKVYMFTYFLGELIDGKMHGYGVYKFYNDGGQYYG